MSNGGIGTHQPEMIGYDEVIRSQLFDIVKNQSLERLKELMEDFDLPWGQIVNMRDPLGNTLLHYASQRGDVDTIEFLFENFRGIICKNHKGENGKTPKDIAINDATRELFDVPQDVDSENVNDSLKIQQYTRKNDVSNVRTLLTSNFKLLVVTDVHGESLLHIAIKKKSFAVFNMLLEHQDLYTMEDRDGKYPFELISISNSRRIVDAFMTSLSHKHEKLREEVLKHKTERDQTILHLILRNRGQKFVDHFLTSFFRILSESDFKHVRNVVDSEGCTALHIAVRRGYKAAVLLLLSKGWTDSIVNKKGETPLSRMSIVTEQISGTSIASDYGTPLNLHRAIIDHVEEGLVSDINTVVRRGYLENPGSSGLSPLLSAVMNRNYFAAEKLVENGANPHAGSALSPLLAAQSLKDNRMEEILKKIPEKFAGRRNLGSKSSEGGEGPLFDSIFFKNLEEMAKQLCPLHEAVKSVVRTDVERVIDICKKLGTLKYIINSYDGCGFTPLHIFIAWPDNYILALLIKAGAKIDAEDGTNRWSPLMYATINHNVPAARILLNNGANPLKCNNDITVMDLLEDSGTGSVYQIRTALQDMINFKRGSIVSRFLDITTYEDLKRFLRVQGLTENTLETALGSPPLNLAIEAGSTKLFSSLLELDIDHNAEDENGNTALDVAVSRGRVEMVKELLSLGYYSIKDSRIGLVLDEATYNLLSEFAKGKINAFCDACEEKNREKALQLLKSGMELLNAEFLSHNDPSFVRSPLHTVVRMGDVQLMREIVKTEPDDEAINLFREKSKTPLYLAAELNNSEMFDVLEEGGASIYCSQSYLEKLVGSKSISSKVKVKVISKYLQEVKKIHNGEKKWDAYLGALRGIASKI